MVAVHGQATHSDGCAGRVPLVRLEDAIELQEQGRLAGAVGPHQGDLFADVDRERDAIQRQAAVRVAIAQGIQAQGFGQAFLQG